MAVIEDWPYIGNKTLMYTNGLIGTNITGRNAGSGRSLGLTVRRHCTVFVFSCAFSYIYIYIYIHTHTVEAPLYIPFTGLCGPFREVEVYRISQNTEKIWNL